MSKTSTSEYLTSTINFPSVFKIPYFPSFLTFRNSFVSSIVEISSKLISVTSLPSYFIKPYFPSFSTFKTSSL